jgi:hypothetical protein
MPSREKSQVSEDSLGKLELIFSMSIFLRIFLWALGIFAVLGGLALPVFYKLKPPATVGLDFTYVLIIGITFAFLGVVLILVDVYYRKLRFELYEAGLVRDHRGTRDAISFAEVLQYRDTLNGIQFELADGRSVYWSLGQTQSPFDFRDIIRARVCNCLWPAVKNRFLQGEQIKFDDLTMDQKKITYKGKKLPWNKVSAITVIVFHGARTLSIEEEGAYFAFCKVSMGPRGGVPNHFLVEKIVALVRPDLLSVSRTPS